MNEEEFEKQTLNKLITDLKDIDKYTSFKNGAFIYDLGKYQGTLLINHIEQLQQENKQLKDKNNHIEQWWKETNVIIRNEKSLAINDNAMEYILSLEHKIDKAIEVVRLCNTKCSKEVIEILKGDE